MIKTRKLFFFVVVPLVLILSIAGALRPLVLTALIDEKEIIFSEMYLLSVLASFQTIYLLLALESLDFFCSALLALALSRFSASIGKEWRDSLASAMLKNMAGHADEALGKFVTLTKSYVDTVEVFYRLYFFQTVGAVLQLFLAITMASSLNGIVGFILTLEIIALFLVTLNFSNIHVRLAERRFKADEKLLGNAFLSPRKALSIWFGGVGTLWLTQRKKEINEVELSHIYIGVGEGVFFAVNSLIIGLWVVVAYVVIHFYNFGEQRDFIAFFIYSGLLMGPVHRLSSFLHEYREYSLACKSLRKEVAISYTRPKDCPLHKSLSFEFSIELPGFYKNRIVDTLSFRAPQRIALLGPSGSGKTTTLESMFGARPNSSAMIAGSLAEKIRFDLPQMGLKYLTDTPVFEAGTILFNTQCSFERCNEISQKFMIFPSLGELEFKRFLERIIFSSGEPLSLGERQRVQLLRTLVSQPKVLFLDEALSGVEEEVECAIISKLINENSIEVILYVGHRRSVQKLFDDQFLIRPNT